MDKTTLVREILNSKAVVQSIYLIVVVLALLTMFFGTGYFFVMPIKDDVHQLVVIAQQGMNSMDEMHKNLTACLEKDHK